MEIKEFIFCSTIMPIAYAKSFTPVLINIILMSTLRNKNQIVMQFCSFGSTKGTFSNVTIDQLYVFPALDFFKLFIFYVYFVE